MSNQRYIQALNATLKELRSELVKMAWPAHFLPGLDNQVIDAVGLPFRLPDDVRTVYMFAGGWSPPGLIKEFWWIKLEDMIYAVRELAHLYPQNWLPVLENGGGDYLYVNCCKPSRSMVYLFRVYDGIYEVPMYDNLLSLFQTILEGHRHRVFGLSETGARILQDDGTYRQHREVTTDIVDEETWNAIYSRFNPISAAATESSEGI